MEDIIYPKKKHGKFDGKSSINHIYIYVYGTYHNLSNFLMRPQKVWE